jgi:hypothetical protein
LINTNFRFYKQMNDDPDFEAFFLGWPGAGDPGGR